MSGKDSVKVQCRGKTLAKETEEESNITKKDAIHSKSDGKCQAMARGPKKVTGTVYLSEIPTRGIEPLLKNNMDKKFTRSLFHGHCHSHCILFI